MKKTLILIFLGVTLGIQAQKITFRVMQFNIWLEGSQITGGFDAIVNEVIQNNADLVTFNEVLNGNNTHFNDRMVAALKEKGKTYYSFFSDDSGILSRYPILRSASVYPEKADTGSIYKAIIQVGDRQIALYSAHLDYTHYACYLPRGYSGETWKRLKKPVISLDSVLKSALLSKRLEEIKAVVADAEAEFKNGNPVIIGGDFNEPSHLDWVETTKSLFDHNGMIIPWPVSTYLTALGYLDTYRQLYPDPVTYPGFTYPADNPQAEVKKLTWAPKADERERIDFIYYKPLKGLTLKNAVIVGPKGCIVKSKRMEEISNDRFVVPFGNWPTDHKAVLATFELAVDTF
jgi:endonuclease/exonuclease/phosphatase family metal-dependent hydrolase